jgi:phosphate starvation-inducible protein PhoH and related proteins
MSSKKPKITSQTEQQLESAIRANQFSRKLKLYPEDFTDKQKSFVGAAMDSELNMLFVQGPAGTTKTYLAIYCGLKMLSEQKVEQLVYVRSAVESADHKLGFLPGDRDDKLQPYLKPLVDKMEELITPVDIHYLTEEQRITGIPVSFCRGANWKNKCIVIDEAQNLTEKELITLITRVADGSKVLICGDSMQSDIGGKTGFANIMNVFSDEESETHGIQSFVFTEDDILRSELVKYIITKLKSL